MLENLVNNIETKRLEEVNPNIKGRLIGCAKYCTISLILNILQGNY